MDSIKIISSAESTEITATGTGKSFSTKKAVTPMGNGSTAWNPKNNKTTHKLEILWPAPLEGSSTQASLRRSVERKCIGQQQWWASCDWSSYLLWWCRSRFVVDLYFRRIPHTVLSCLSRDTAKKRRLCSKTKSLSTLSLLNHFNLFGNSYMQSVESYLWGITREWLLESQQLSTLNGSRTLKALLQAVRKTIQSWKLFAVC